MHFLLNECYHIYNRGNNQQRIFFNDENYFFFLEKMKMQLAPAATFINFCLMPNHFHFIICANENSVRERPSFGGKPMQELAYRIGILQSSYAQAINKQNKTSGSLFQQKTKAKILSEMVENKMESYLENCFFYVHNNPTAARIVTSLKGWLFSSYPDYIGIRNSTLCNRELFYQLTGLTKEYIINKDDDSFTDELLGKIF